MSQDVEARVEQLLSRMTLQDKIGQMAQASGASPEHEELTRQGQLGSILNIVDVETVNRYQRMAMEESPQRIPLIIGRDVIHGFRTIFPIPLGQAAAWDPELVEQAAAIAAREAASMGIRWTFAPMVDVARDPRWGRIAEGGGEDPYVTSLLGAAMVRGFQGEDMSDPEHIAACAKHYVGYGAAEGGRDYNTTLIPERTLRDVYLPPFKACVDAGVATVMSAFNEINGIPATGNVHTLREILKGEFGFGGFVVSDWNSVMEMVVHGFCADAEEAALAAVTAGVDMEMVSDSFRGHLEALVNSGRVPLELIDDAVRRILRVKVQLGLFENPYVDPQRQQVLLSPGHLEVARELARKSFVLLKNDRDLLPIPAEARTIAVVGPMADRPLDQMGCWAYDGRPGDVITPLQAIRERAGDRVEILYAPGLESPRDVNRRGFLEAARMTRRADLTLLFLGEDAILSGEAHNRAFLDLPGAQEALIDALISEGRPVVAVVMTGRPLVLTSIIDKVDALLIAWHPGTMGGPALADVLFGDVSPSGKLTASFPRAVGQIPIYYAHKNTGRPPQPTGRQIPTGTPLDPIGFFSGYLDVEPTPLFPFGYGLSYTTFAYRGLHLSSERIRLGEELMITAEVANTGPREAEEVVQLYVRDLVGSVTRPVKELKGFQRVRLAPGQSAQVTFTLSTDDLRFHDREMKFVAEPGRFHVWVGGSSAEGLQGAFEIVS
ncbi:MAG: glycoside hydrolase family 3 N-terminal domain-containing protein [Anaerolineae bacterium]